MLNVKMFPDCMQINTSEAAATTTNRARVGNKYNLIALRFEIELLRTLSITMRSWWMLMGLTSILLMTASTTKGQLNDTCMDQKNREVHEQFEEAFKCVAETPIYNHVHVLKYHKHSELDHNTIMYEVNVRYTKADNTKQRLYSRMLNFCVSNDNLIQVNEGTVDQKI